MKEYYNNNYNDLINLFKTFGYKDDIYSYGLKFDDVTTYYIDYDLETSDICISITYDDNDDFYTEEITEEETHILNNLILDIKLDKDLKIKKESKKIVKI